MPRRKENVNLMWRNTAAVADGGLLSVHGIHGRPVVGGEHQDTCVWLGVGGQTCVAQRGGHCRMGSSG